MPSFSLRNPHTIIAGALIITILGFNAFARMPVDVFPPLHIPAVIVATFYPGMPPQEMERDITTRFERFFMMGSEIQHIESRSLPGVSIIRVFFHPGINLPAAAAGLGNLAIAGERPRSGSIGGRPLFVQHFRGVGERLQQARFDRSCQNVLLVPLTSEAGGATVGNTTADDTVFANSAKGALLVADKSADKVYSISTPYFAPGAAYTAVVATATPGGMTVAAFVGRTDLTKGFVNPVLDGLLNPGGMAFIPVDRDAELESAAGGKEANESP